MFAACTEVARLTVACTRAACLPERSRRARRAGVHARCFGLASLECIMLTLLCYRYKPTSEMTTSEMTTSETIKTSEKKYQTSGCARGPKNCETNRPSAQAPDPKSSKPHELKRAKNCATLLRYTDEMRETIKASETKHEASGCACEPHELRAPRTANTRDQETESRTKNTQVPLTARVLTSFRQVPGVADLGARRREGDAGEEASRRRRCRKKPRGEGDVG